MIRYLAVLPFILFSPLHGATSGCDPKSPAVMAACKACSGPEGPYAIGSMESFIACMLNAGCDLGQIATLNNVLSACPASGATFSIINNIPSLSINGVNPYTSSKATYTIGIHSQAQSKTTTVKARGNYATVTAGTGDNVTYEIEFKGSGVKTQVFSKKMPTVLPKITGNLHPYMQVNCVPPNKLQTEFFYIPPEGSTWTSFLSDALITLNEGITCAN